MKNNQKFVFYSDTYSYTPDDLNETAKTHLISTWNEVSEVLSTRTYNTPDGDVVVTTDWEEAKNVLICSASRTLSPMHPRKRPKRNYDVPVECLVSLPDNVKNCPSHFLELYLYEFFLCMNFSAPGSCDFFSAYMDPSRIPTERQTFESCRLGLSSCLFEYAWDKDIEKGWGLIERIPLRDVVSWFDSLEIGTRQIASTRMERSLFAILRLCSINDISPSALVWLAHILEALYDTPNATITKSLQDRICSVLDVPKEKRKSFCKLIRKFYGARSEFVHGEFAITHPLANDIIDRNAHRLDNYLSTQIEFASTVFISTIQKHIIQGWREIDFSEIHRGIGILEGINNG